MEQGGGEIYGGRATIFTPCRRQVEVFRNSFQGTRYDQTRAPFIAPSVDGKNVVNHGSRSSSSRYRCMLKVGRLAEASRIAQSVESEKILFLVRPVLGPLRLGPNGSTVVERGATTSRRGTISTSSSHVFHICSTIVPSAIQIPFFPPRSSDRQRTHEHYSHDEGRV